MDAGAGRGGAGGLWEEEPMLRPARSGGCEDVGDVEAMASLPLAVATGRRARSWSVFLDFGPSILQGQGGLLLTPVEVCLLCELVVGVAVGVDGAIHLLV